MVWIMPGMNYDYDMFLDGNYSLALTDISALFPFLPKDNP